nr:hypothetical protein [Thermoactinospora rubra]
MIPIIEPRIGGGALTVAGAAAAGLVPAIEDGLRLRGGSFGPVNSDFDPWPAADIGAPLNAKHCPIAGMGDAGRDALVSRWGLPNRVRPKSSNSPDSCVRHADRAGRVRSSSFDPPSQPVVSHAARPRRVDRGVPRVGERAGKPPAASHRRDPSGCRRRLPEDPGRHDPLPGAGAAGSGWSSPSSAYPICPCRARGYVVRIDPMSASAAAPTFRDAS